MSGLTYRDTKLAELEHVEVDENFRYLDQKSSEYVVGHIFRGPVQRIYNGQLYLLSPGVTFPFTAIDFAVELAAGNWQLLGTGTSYKGELNLTTPVLENGTGTIGDYYKVIEAGNYDFGAGDIAFNFGDYVIYDGSVYGFYVDNNQLVSSSYLKKDYDKVYTFNASGTDVEIPFNVSGYSTIELTGSLTSVKGFSFTDLTANPTLAEWPHKGKPFILINRSGHDIELKHNNLTTIVPFNFDSGSGIVIPNNGKFLLKLMTNSVIDIFKSWNITPQTTIVANTTLSEIHNNKIVKIKSNVTITIPTGLSKDFNCVFRCFVGATATFVGAGGVTMDAQTGLILEPYKMATLFKDGASETYILTGETST